jgi:hypothetical protein
MTSNHQPQRPETQSDTRPTVIPVRRDSALFNGWGVRV